MAELTLTKHFKERWLERVGNWPTVEAVQHYMDHSVKVQRCEDFKRLDGRPYRILAIYWHPELDLVIKVDTMQRAAVTVMTRENWTHQDAPEFLCKQPAPGPKLAARIARIREAFSVRRMWPERRACD